MILKTGANYQAEGGYIEASRDGDTATVRTENKTVTIPSLTGITDTRVLCSLGKGENTSSGTYYSISGSQAPYISGGQALPEYPNTASIWLLFTVGALITLTNKTPILLEGSKDCELRSGPSASSRLLFATGPNPIAIIGEAE